MLLTLINLIIYLYEIEKLFLFGFSVLVRTKEDGIGVEELDTLQTELETLLASVAKRMRQLESEIQTLSNWQDNKSTPPSGKPDKTKGKGVSLFSGSTSDAT